AETAADDAQALVRDLELDPQQVKLGKPVAYLSIARSDDEQHGARARQRLAVGARERRRLATFFEQEADIADDEGHGVRERPQRRRDRAWLRELVDRLPWLGRREQHRWPPRPAHEPALEQLAERAVARGTGTDEPEQRAVVTVGGESQIQPAAEEVAFDQRRRPPFLRQRGERSRALARARGAPASDDREDAAPLGAPPARLVDTRRPRLRGLRGTTRGACQLGAQLLEVGVAVDDGVDAEGAQRGGRRAVERQADEPDAGGAKARAACSREGRQVRREQHDIRLVF